MGKIVKQDAYLIAMLEPFVQLHDVVLPAGREATTPEISASVHSDYTMLYGGGAINRH